MNDIASMTGADNYKKLTLPQYNEIMLQGQMKEKTKDRDTGEPIRGGSFKLVNTTATKESEDRFTVTQLPDELHMVILKIRRDLQSYRKGEATLRTSEHNTKYDKNVVMFGLDEPVRGTADELREKFNLKTRQIVYAYIPELGGIHRVVVKGTQQFKGREEKGDRQGLFEYLKNFEGEEHAHQFVTVIKGVEVPSEDYYSIDFRRGDKLTEEQLSKVETMIRDLHERITQVDEFYARRNQQQGEGSEPKDTLPEIQIDEVEEDEEGGVEINPEDIPF